ncbi:TrkH family potassium uptake protein [Vagococcus sp.]|uniref:TrkH family potassium uptake protein n=1 Tax=Vagococcus sp. TaxID=1933889 RepID=UPI003F98EC68
MFSFGRFYYQLKRRGHLYINTHFSSVQIIFTYYILITLLAFLLLSLPFFHKEQASPSWYDTLFMAVSTVSVTGLSTFNINEVYNERGIVLLEIMFQIGSLGIMMISTFLFILAKKKISLRTRQLIMTDMNQPKLSGSIRLIKSTIYTLFMLQMSFGIIFSFRFYYIEAHATVNEAIFNGFYQSISAITNSGFDVTGYSAAPYANDSFSILSLILLITIGGIGFPVLMEIREWITFKRTKENHHFRFSLFSKLAMSTYIILFIFGALMIFFIEEHHLFQNMSSAKQWLNAMFYSSSARNAGLQLHDIHLFQESTLLLLALLMFIGCSPSSVGGGIRTTTVAIVVLYVVSLIKGEKNVSIFSRRIDAEDIRKAVVVTILSLSMCFVAVLILSITEEQSLISIIMEVSSAFGTTGLSLGITPSLSTIGKIIIALLMFIGRIGMLYTLMIFVPKERQDHGYLYPTEKIIIG